jgi:NAD(P)-dependent dehydrogenase (short-subunit alcohol dehydrogenase family)
MNPSGPRRLVRAALTSSLATALAGTLVLVAPTGADARRHQPDPRLTPRTHFVMAPDGSTGLTASGERIPNIDSVKATIRRYYNASRDGIADKTSSPYITGQTLAVDGGMTIT